MEEKMETLGLRDKGDFVSRLSMGISRITM